ncbi:hypothetical protein [Pseudomonas sp. BLCC-B112]|uniref:hypothetical protein n=1 Tax=Pseudomonas sp. BLCC-B112 TaxID=3025319 RepID=UPI00234CE0CB|nr:hypothetical protein [Pseudomonas sp. BLCC-B112]MDC7814426.1 hypothetical protein [Pseudomonas sp. BLCC-B112]
MQLLVSCDYLISPANCSHSDLASCIESLIFIKRDLESGSPQVIIEDNSLTKLDNMGCFPCASIFNYNLQGFEEFEFSGRDIARTVNNILSMEPMEQNRLPECVAEWKDRSVTPLLMGSTEERTGVICSLLEEISLAKRFFEKNYSILHHPVDSTQHQIAIKGAIESFLPETADNFPLDLHETFSIYTAYKTFASNLDGFSLYQKANTEYEYKSAFFVGTMVILCNRGMELSSLKWENFSLGNHFLKSLSENQCISDHNFSHVCFDVICHMLAGVPKYDCDPFYTGTNRTEQRTKDGKLAWRTHITKGNPALRLMYWTEKSGEIELANVGKKNDLLIC